MEFRLRGIHHVHIDSYLLGTSRRWFELCTECRPRPSVNLFHLYKLANQGDSVMPNLAQELKMIAARQQ